MMKKSSAILAVLMLKLFVLTVTLCISAAAVHAQKSEHYNSPLYSPRTYDPADAAGNGLPPALQEVGIDQKLGEPGAYPSPE